VSELVLSRPEPLEAYVKSMIDTALVPEQQREGYVARVLDHLPWDRKGGGQDQDSPRLPGVLLAASAESHRSAVVPGMESVAVRAFMYFVFSFRSTPNSSIWPLSRYFVEREGRAP
jgi:hypothetical protein